MSYHLPTVFHTAYIALGSNLGDRDKAMRLALAELDQSKITRVIRVSTFLENPAVGGPIDSPPFLNAAARIATSLSPAELLRQLLRTEQGLGRLRREKWGPRSIDLDLLMYENQIIHDEGLIVPHPLMHQRRFVLEPLAEIAGELVHPALHKSITQLLSELT